MIRIGGLESYIEGDILTSWDGEVDASALEATRITLRELASDLIAIAGKKPSVDQIGALFASCIERLNALDAKHEFICTIEREDLCEELYSIGDLCDVGDDVEEWLSDRDW